ncbi:MAG: hypothetical protein WCW66_04865 [Patescibacteria group bacterium]
MTFIGNTQLPKFGDIIQITIPGNPGFVLKVTVISEWAIDQEEEEHISFVFFLPRDSFPLVFARRVVTLDKTNEKWTVRIKNGESTIIQEVTVNILRD